MGKLRLRHHLDGVIPFLRGLQAQLAGVSDEVVGGLERMNRVALGSLVSQAKLQLVVPLHLLLVVIVGLHRKPAQERIVALAALVPVARHIVLHELQVVVAPDGPEVRSGDDDVHRDRIRLYRLRRHLLHDVRMILLRLVLGNDRRTHRLEMSLRVAHQVGATQIDIHQGLVYHARERVGGLRPRVQAQQAVGRRVIKRKRGKKLRIATIVRRHPLHRVDTPTTFEERVGIVFHPLLVLRTFLHRLLAYTLRRGSKRPSKKG